jgi:superfamily I DNA/RNA helicase
MAWDQDLAGVHRSIAAYPGSSLRVLAGPGTGKTFALMRRVARLLESDVDPAELLAVTFTRTAALDLVQKLSELGVAGAEHVTAITLHAFSFGLLSRSAVFDATGRVARPLLAHELEMLIADLRSSFGGKRQVRRLMEAFDAYWAKLQHHTPGWPQDPNEQQFDTSLRHWLRFHGGMLIGELIPLALDFVAQNPLHPNVPRFAHVLVDEYQDLNRADQALIDALATGAAVTVVGDEDQSIYSFRYAHPEGIVEYPTGHAHTHDELLAECRRCPRRIVAMANALIARNRRQEPKVLMPFNGNQEGTVYIVQHQDIDAEITCLAAYIDHYLHEHPDTPAGEVLVLANRRPVGNGIKDELNRRASARSTPWAAQSFYFEDCLQEMSAAEGFTLLTLLVHPEDRVALRAWLGLDSQDGRAGAYRRLQTYCEKHDQSPSDVLTALQSGTLALAYTSSLVARFRILQERLHLIRELQVPDLVPALFPDSDVGCSDVRALATTAASDAEDAGALLTELRLLITQPELPSVRDNTVRVMSFHKSKGLTAKLVVLAGCVNGVLPYIDIDLSPGEQRRQREEQRRLFYVGITRATDTLVISNAVRLPAGQAWRMNVPFAQQIGGSAVLQASPFLAELGQEAPSAISGARWRQDVNF